MITGQADMLPSKRCDMGQKVVGDFRSLSAQMPDGAVEIDCVPVNNGGGDEAQARCAKALVFEGAVSNFALTVKEHRASQRVARLALVETGMTALGERRIG
jgi:hypothetical protein